MEIGSIFEIASTDIILNHELSVPTIPLEKRDHLNSYYFNTGRTAIEAILTILKSRGYRTVLLPSYVCDTVRDAALRAKMELEYYRVNIDLSIDVSTIPCKNNSVLYIVQYFGQKINDEMISHINIIKKSGVVVIEDISLTLLSDEENYVGFGDYIIGSLRKWLPIVDGGILLSKEPLYFELENASNDYTLYCFIAQLLKSAYLKSGTMNKEWKQIFLSYNGEGMNALFNDYTLRKMSRLSLDLMRGIDFENVRKQRIKNYDLLKSMLATIPKVKIMVDRQGTMTPLGMMILSEDRDNLLQYLISRDIYCNVHWRSNESIKRYSESEYLASRCITIPCDQRYGEYEMEFIYQAISDYYRM